MPGRDKTVSLQPTLTLLGPRDLEMLYRGDWLSRKIVDVPAFDITRAWRRWNADEPQVKALEKAERELGIQRKVLTALIKARLFGGSCIIIGADQGKFNDELKVEEIGEGDLKFLHVIDRWQIAAGALVRDVTSPWFGEPSYYRRTNVVTIQAEELHPPLQLSSLGLEPGEQFVIHPSRVIRFLGLDYPDIERAMDSWGDSVLQPIYDAIRDAGLVANSIAALVAESKLDIIKVPGLSNTLSTEEGARRLTTRFMNTNAAKSVVNAVLLDKDEEWDRKELAASGFDKILQMYLSITAGASDIPATRLLGKSPDGMNATGDSDVRNYYDHLSSVQQMRLRPLLSRIDEVLIRHALGDRDDDIDYTWNPLWQVSDTEKADIAVKKAQAHQVDVTSGLIPMTALARARQNQLIEDDTYPGLELALDEAEAEGDTVMEPLLPTPQGGPEMPPGAAPGGPAGLRWSASGWPDGWWPASSWRHASAQAQTQTGR